jgi:type IV pilus assembly protein PilM
MAKAKPKPGVWGIDIGQCALKAIRLELAEGEKGEPPRVLATAFDYVEHPKILSQPDADPDQLTRAALEQFLSRNKVKGDQIAISVPGQTGLARFVKLPPVEPKKIPDIVHFEAKQQIPFPLDEVVWAWQSLGTQGEGEGFVEHEIGLFAMKRDMVNRYLQVFKDVKVEIHFVQMAPLALCNFVTHDLLGLSTHNNGEEPAKKQCVVALDIGADNTSLVITDGGRIIWQRPIPIGGNHFTRALTKDLKLTFAKAEHLKRNAVKAEDPRKIFQAMKPVFADFVAEAKRSLGFFTNTHREVKISRIVGLGNAFRLPGLQRFISQHLETEVEKLTSFHRLAGNDEVLKAPVFADNLLSFTVAYGLAVQGLQQARLQTNLLPDDIQFERVIRAKKPWAAAAIACLWIGMAALIAFVSLRHQDAAAAKKRADDTQRVLTQKANFIRLFDEAKNKRDTAVKAAAAVNLGGEERKNWLLIHRFVNEALPQADFTNVPQEFQTDAAKKAFESRKRHSEGDKTQETDISQLTQVAISGIWIRSCNLPMAKSFYDNIRKGERERDPFGVVPDTDLRMKALKAEWEEQRKKPPEREGHAVEVRGFTHHTDRETFVRKTLIPNLLELRKNWKFSSDPFTPPIDMAISHLSIFHIETTTLEPGKQAGFLKINQGGLVLDSLVNVPVVATTQQPPATQPDGSVAAAPKPLPPRPAWPGISDLLARSAGIQSTPPLRGQLPRTEFVLVFYWVEPLPTEELVKSVEAAAQAAAGQAAPGAPGAPGVAPAPAPAPGAGKPQ